MIRDAARSLFGGEDAVAEPRPAAGWAWPLALVFLLGSFVLVLRRPEAVVLPQFFAEDGAVFFRDAYQMPFQRSVLLPHAGYQNLLPRILAEAASLAPLQHAPALFNVSALFIAVVSLCWIALPHFRHLIPGDCMRAGLAMVLWVAPNQEALMKLSYVQWYVLLWLALVSLMRFPRSPICRYSLAVACVIAFLTTPVAAVVLPVWALRAWAARDRQERSFCVAMLLVGTAVLVANLMTPYTGPAPLPDWHVQPVRIAQGILNGIAYKVVCSMGGAQFAAWLATLGWWAVYLVCAVVVGALAAAFLRLSREGRLLGLILLWLIVGSVACFALRPYFLEDFALGRNLRLHDRYFFLALCLAYLALFVALARLPGQRWSTGRSRVVGTVLLLVALALHLPTFRYRWTPVDQHWYEVAESLRRLQDEVNRIGVPGRAIIPINPAGWNIDLELQPGTEATATGHQGESRFLPREVTRFSAVPPAW